MTSSISARVGCAAFTIALATAVGLMPIPGAGAATLPTFDAVGSWLVDGPTASNVSLQVTETQGERPSLFFFVSQQFCDAAHDQEVFRSFSGSLPEDRTIFAIGAKMSGAALNLRHVPMSGSEQRVDGCTTTAQRAVRSSGVHTHSLSSFRASILANWTATGPYHEVQPGIHAREATAFGVELSGGPLNLGDIGASGFAELRKTRLPPP